MQHSSSFKSFAIIAVSIFCAVSLFSAESKIRIMKTALAKNPTLFFKGVAGSAALTKRVANDVSHCGWFNVVDLEHAAEYTLSGSISGRTLRFSLKRGGIDALSFSMPFNNKKIVSISQRSVDHILKKLFRVDKLCRSKIAFCAETKPGRKEIFICDYDGGNIKRITRNGTLSVEPDWEPKQKRLVYTMYGKSNTDIVEYDLKSRRSRRLIHFPGLNTGAAVSPDGKYFAAILSKDGSVDLYLKSLTTSFLRRLTQGKSAESSPCWSPSGAKICYVSDMSGSPRLYVLSVNKKNRIRLKTLGTEAVSPDWSSEGKIIYSAKMGRNYALAMYDVAGDKTSKVVIAAAGDWESPSWAPDNRHVVASRKLNGRSNLYVIDTWTGRARRILAGRIHFSMPSW
ncbi:MAG: PD40 domain-containing protein [Victivallales bacterium]|nr:PD40 domain-containing protein [Victivallales bacterium]